MQQSRVFVGMVLILIFAEVLGLYGYDHLPFFIDSTNPMQSHCCAYSQYANECIVVTLLISSVQQLLHSRKRNGCSHRGVLLSGVFLCAVVLCIRCLLKLSYDSRGFPSNCIPDLKSSSTSCVEHINQNRKGRLASLSKSSQVWKAYFTYLIAIQTPMILAVAKQGFIILACSLVPCRIRQLWNVVHFATEFIWIRSNSIPSPAQRRFSDLLARNSPPQDEKCFSMLLLPMSNLGGA